MNARLAAAYIRREYPSRIAPPVACRLVRAYTNDVYAVTSGSGERFALKVYGAGWRTASEVRYEADLMAHLAARGLPVPLPLARTDGDILGRIDTPEGSRLAVLSAWAPGEKPRPPFSPALYVRFGEAIARMHALSDDFASPHERRPIDLRFLIDAPLVTILPRLADPADRADLSALAARLRGRIATFAAEGLDWGPIHGDASMDNLHVTVDGTIVLFDFDSGGPGWRAADLQGWAADPEHREKWRAFRKGYTAVRPEFAPANWRAAPWLTAATDLWGIQVDLENRVLHQGPEPTARFLSERVRSLREREPALLAAG
jgi:Putative homoserine kinase type II (protein kinase fold)